MVEDYIEILKEAIEQLKDKTIAVKDLTLCPREKVFQKIDPVPLTNDALYNIIAGEVAQKVMERMLMIFPNRFRFELDIQYKNARGKIDIFDKLTDTVIEVKWSQSQKAKAFKPHEEQIRYYMAMKGCEKGVILYIISGSGKLQPFEIVMTEEERIKQLEKLESEAYLMQNAMTSSDPSIARSIYNDEDMRWKCINCPYKERCKALELSSLGISPVKQ